MGSTTGIYKQTKYCTKHSYKLQWLELTKRVLPCYHEYSVTDCHLHSSVLHHLHPKMGSTTGIYKQTKYCTKHSYKLLQWLELTKRVLPCYHEYSVTDCHLHSSVLHHLHPKMGSTTGIYKQTKYCTKHSYKLQWLELTKRVLPCYHEYSVTDCHLHSSVLHHLHPKMGSTTGIYKQTKYCTKHSYKLLQWLELTKRVLPCYHEYSVTDCHLHSSVLHHLHPKMGSTTGIYKQTKYCTKHSYKLQWLELTKRVLPCYHEYSVTDCHLHSSVLHHLHPKMGSTTGIYKQTKYCTKHSYKLLQWLELTKRVLPCYHEYSVTDCHLHSSVLHHLHPKMGSTTGIYKQTKYCTKHSYKLQWLELTKRVLPCYHEYSVTDCHLHSSVLHHLHPKMGSTTGIYKQTKYCTKHSYKLQWLELTKRVLPCYHEYSVTDCHLHSSVLHHLHPKMGSTTGIYKQTKYCTKHSYKLQWLELTKRVLPCYHEYRVTDCHLHSSVLHHLHPKMGSTTSIYKQTKYCTKHSYKLQWLELTKRVLPCYTSIALQTATYIAPLASSASED